MNTKICKYCKKTFEYNKHKDNISMWERRKYCSLSCAGAAKKGIKVIRSDKWTKNFYKAMKKMKGRKFTEEHKRNMSLAHSKLKKPWTSKRNHEHSGEKHPNWKGGISPMGARLRQTKEHKEWAQLVFQRDKYTCQSCGQKGGVLNAHHIKPFAKYPGSRLDLENGITLCYKCHRKAHKDIKK